MTVHVNFIAVIVSTLAAMVIGGLWYSRPLFGKAWAEMARVDEAKAKKTMPIAMLSMLVGAFVKSYFLALLIGQAHDVYNHSFMKDSLATATMVWFGFVLFQIMTRNLFEQAKFKLTLIQAANELVIFVAIGLIIGAIGI